jgi:MFS family permease
VLLLGVVGFCGQIPTLVLAPFAGVLVDRWNRHRILVVTQVLSMLQSFALAGLSFAGIITVRDVLLLQIAQGIINAFDTPARQSFVSEMVADRADLPNAIALNSSMVNLSRVIGPSIGGVIIAAVGEAWCFAVDGVSYVAVIASLFAMRVALRPRPATTTNVREELVDGLPVRDALAGDPLRPAAARAREHDGHAVLRSHAGDRANVLGGDSHTLGFLMTASGLGALAGALYLASRAFVIGLGRSSRSRRARSAAGWCCSASRGTSCCRS